MMMMVSMIKIMINTIDTVGGRKGKSGDYNHHHEELQLT